MSWTPRDLGLIANSASYPLLLRTASLQPLIRVTDDLTEVCKNVRPRSRDGRTSRDRSSMLRYTVTRAAYEGARALLAAWSSACVLRVRSCWNGDGCPFMGTNMPSPLVGRFDSRLVHGTIERDTSRQPRRSSTMGGPADWQRSLLVFPSNALSLRPLV